MLTSRLSNTSIGAGMIGVALTLCLSTTPCFAQTRASAERAEAARGHYARARALLVEALAEFERGRRIARPDVLLDADQWRLTIVSRTEELNRVLDPQPRVTRSGVRFKANPLLIHNERAQRKPVERAVYDSNERGEQRMLPSALTTRSEAPEESVISQPEIAVVEPTPIPAEPVEAIAPTLPETVTIEATPEPEATDVAASPVEQAETADVDVTADDAAASDEDLEISKAIEAAIKARLQKMGSSDESL